MSDRMVANVRRFSKATGYAKFLLLTIASHIHHQAVYAFPSLDTLARETTLSKPTVIHLIRTLEALGELEVRRGHGRGHPNRYRVTLDHEAPPEGSPEDDDDPPKGKPMLDLLKPEKVKAEVEKVNDPPEKGQASVDPKEVLRTFKNNTERGSLVKVKGQDRTTDEPEYEYWYNHNPWHRPCGTYHLRGQPCPPVWGTHRRHET
jgi:hypothetical protein